MAEFSIENWTEIYAPNAAMLRLTMERQGFRVYQWGDMPGAIYGLRKYAQVQSHWVVSGALEITVDKGNVVYVLKTGDRDFISPETWFSMRVLDEETLEKRENVESEAPKPVIYLIGEKINR